MRCQEVLSQLDDYVAGTLAPREAGQVSAHLEGCEACRREEWGLRSLLHEAAALPHSIEPARDLWAGIAARLGEQEGPGEEASSFPPVSGRGPAWRSRVWLAAAAAVLLVAALGIVWRAVAPGGPAGPEGGSRAVVPVAAVPAPAPEPGAAVPAGTAAAEVAFRQAKGEIRALVNDLSKNLSPKTVQEIDRNLRLIDEAVREIQEALERDPGNRELRKILVATRHREVAMLQQVVQRTMPHRSPTRSSEP
jgi:hypothetical protein